MNANPISDKYLSHTSLILIPTTFNTLLETYPLDKYLDKGSASTGTINSNNILSNTPIDKYLSIGSKT